MCENNQAGDFSVPVFVVSRVFDECSCCRCVPIQSYPIRSRKKRCICFCCRGRATAAGWYAVKSECVWVEEAEESVCKDYINRYRLSSQFAAAGWWCNLHRNFAAGEILLLNLHKRNPGNRERQAKRGASRAILEFHQYTRKTVFGNRHRRAAVAVVEGGSAT